MYPIKLKPIFKQYIWGGRNLERYGKNLPNGITAESWELSCHKDGISIILNGEYKGKALDQLIKEKGREIIGTKLSSEYINKFPLLIKFIDANSNLSVQVHPDDEYANINENGEFGKNEMWYVVEAKAGATLVSGLKKGTTKEDFKKAIENNDIFDCLNSITVEAGDIINIPAGHIHAISEGLVIIEIQQNANTTYRVFDYNRVDDNGNCRDLHIEKALEVIDFSDNDEKAKYKGIKIRKVGYEITYLVVNKYFAVEKIIVKEKVVLNTMNERFHILTCYKGQGTIKYKEGTEEIKLGETILIPASINEYSITGDIEIIKSYVPDIDNDILKPLQKEGYSLDDIKANIGGMSNA